MKHGILSLITGIFILALGASASAAVISITQPYTFPYKITKPGSYKLVSNIIVKTANQTAIQVLADNVTIDMDGFSIIGPTVCTGSPVTNCTPTGNGSAHGIDSTSHNYVTVKNGTIRGMGNYGVFLNENGTVQNVTAAHNGAAGIYIISGTVTGSRAVSNGGTGIQIDSGTVSDNTSSSNFLVGIYAGEGLIKNNKVSKNGNAGIGLINSGIVTDNVASENGLHGIIATFATVKGNISFSNDGYGLRLNPHAGFSNNTIYNNTSGAVDGGTNAGGNVCDGTLCP